MRSLTKIVCGIALASAVTVGAGAAGAQNLTWSLAATGVGSCNIVAGCGAANPAVYVQQNYQYGGSLNATSTSADSLRGVAHGSANPGVGFLSLPVLHSDVTGGAVASDGSYSWNYSLVDGFIGYTWGGPMVDIAVSAFIGTLDFTNSNSGVGFANASLAILNQSVAPGSALADTWYTHTNSYGFISDCNTPGAIGLATTGADFSKGHITNTLAPSCPGQPTFHLNNGDTFYLWARLMTFEAVNGFVDASHTFTVSLNPNLSQSDVAMLTSNLIEVPTFTVNAAVPEPSAWALLIVGFGGLGAMLRRSHLKGSALQTT
jgi:hypothetical protein